MSESRMFDNAPPRPQLPDPPTEDRLYTYEEVAKYCGVSTQTVWEWVALGKVQSPRYLGYQARFTRQQVVDMGERLHPIGTFPVTESPRAIVARRVMERKRAAAAAAAQAAADAQAEAERLERERAEEAMMALARKGKDKGKRPAKKPAAKKPAAKKPAAKKPAAKVKPAKVKPAKVKPAAESAG
jgi:excisionase family DNA binding protein